MDQYETMWEDFAAGKSKRYLDYKFTPTYRIGLTNFLREKLIYTFLSPERSDVVLDAGCASGRQLFEIKDAIKEGYGTDIAQQFIEQANQKKEEDHVSNLHFSKAVVEKMPFEDAFFDKLICAEVLEHVHDKNVTLAELMRITKPGGRLIISVPNLNADGTWWGRFLRLVRIRKFVPMEHFSVEELAKHGDAHVREFTMQSMREWLATQGLTVEDITTVSFTDGPFFDFLLKFPLHTSIGRTAIIWFENQLSKAHLPWGRHLVVRALKP